MTAFDPSAFISAERKQSQQSQQSQAVATDILVCDIDLRPAKPAEISQSSAAAAKSVAGIATIATSGPHHLIWRDGIELLHCLPQPPGLAPVRWEALLRLAKWTADDWAGKACDMGWHPLEFLGCSTDPYVGPMARLDKDGVVFGIFRARIPRKITDVTPDYVEMQTGRGDILRHRPFGPRGQVYLWEAYAPKGGP